MYTWQDWQNLKPEQKKDAVRDSTLLADIGLDGRNVVLANMEILEKFLELAIKSKRERRHGGSRFLLELIRWNTPLSDHEKTFKINNNMSRVMSRISMALLPELQDFFEIREHRS